MRIVLGVSAGIAAFKAAHVLRGLLGHGHDVHVVPTPKSLSFVGAATWAALSGHAVSVDPFDRVADVAHVDLGNTADLIVVAPATADFIARIASGQADDLLSATLLTATCPVLLAPAMHTQMWFHPATVANVATLRARGLHVLDPAEGRLTGADSGMGRLPEPNKIVDAALELVANPPVTTPRDLLGIRVVISAGGTHEAIDPVRFIGNRSTGRQGFALAQVAAQRGARVTIVAANVALPSPEGVAVIAVESAQELEQVMRQEAEFADIIVMAAAVADYRPVCTSAVKIKKSTDTLNLRLEPTTDILSALVTARRPGQFVVGFAAETGDATADVLTLGAHKARRKGADLLVVNQVGVDVGFGDRPTTVAMLNSEGAILARAQGTKDEVSGRIWDTISDCLARVSDLPGTVAPCRDSSPPNL